MRLQQQVILLLLLLSCYYCNASSNYHQRRSTTRNSINHNQQQSEVVVYDRSVTTFNPNGQLLQVEYANQVISMKSNTIVFAMIVYNTTYIATISTKIGMNDSNEQQQQKESSQPLMIQTNQYIHRLSNNIYMIGIGLLGDIHAIVSYIRVQIQQYIYNHDESMSIQQISNLICKIQHQCTYQTGIRPLGVSCLLFETVSSGSSSNNNDNNNNPSSPPYLIKCTPGGIQEDCNYCIVGHNEDTILESFHPYYIQFLNMNHTNHNHNNTNIQDDNDEANIIELFVNTIQNILVSNKSTTSDNDYNQNVSIPMDVWVIRSRRSDHDNDGINKNHNDHHTFIKNRMITCFAGLCNHPNSFQHMRQYYNSNTTKMISRCT